MLRSGVRSFGAGLLLFGVLAVAWPWARSFDVATTPTRRVGPVVSTSRRESTTPVQSVAARRTIRCLPPYLGSFAADDPAIVKGDVEHWSSCRDRNRRRGAVAVTFATLGLVLVVVLRPRW